MARINLFKPFSKTMTFARMKIPVLVVIIFSFALGIAWGIKIRRDHARALGQLKAAVTVRILAYHGLFPKELIDDFEKEKGMSLEVQEAKDPEDLWEKLEASSRKDAPWVPDLVALFSYQVPLAFQLGRVQSAEPQRLAGFSQVSPDFRSLPGDRAHAQVVPLLWGLDGIAYKSNALKLSPSWRETLNNPKLRGKIVMPSSAADLLHLMQVIQPVNDHTLNKKEKPQPLNIARALPQVLSAVRLSKDFLSPAELLPTALAAGISHGEMAYIQTVEDDWKFLVPEEKGLLWILSLAVVRDAPGESAAREFLEYALRVSVAEQMVRSFHQASTNAGLESSTLDQRLKASYLRQVPLNEVEFWQDFARDREIRDLLEGRPTSPDASKSLSKTSGTRAEAREQAREDARTESSEQDKKPQKKQNPVSKKSAKKSTKKKRGADPDESSGESSGSYSGGDSAEPTPPPILPDVNPADTGDESGD